MYFSEEYRIPKIKYEDCLDPDLEEDTPLFIDPVLILESDNPLAKKAAQKLISFFETAFVLVDKARKQKDSKSRYEAIKMLTFPEVHEIGLGYSETSSRGSGIKSKNAEELFNAFIDFLDFGLDDPIYLGALSLFVEGIGPDRISDLTANVIKKELIEYTQDFCKKHNIPMCTIPLEHIEFDIEKRGWISKRVLLPFNKFNKKGIILTPKEFLRMLPVFGFEDFWNYFDNLESEELRYYTTLGITQRISKKDLIEKLRRNGGALPKIVEERLKSKELLKPYDFEHDPLLLRQPEWLTERSIEKSNKINFIVKDDASFEKFVQEVLIHIQNMIENEGAYILLYDDDSGKPKNEKNAQKLIYCIAKGFCIKSDVDISPEVDTGSGLIDFKFSHGYSRRCLVEVKFVKSSLFKQGIEKQLPKYLKAQEIEKGFILAICCTQEDIDKIPEALGWVKTSSKENKKEILLIPIDATPNKKSASKL